MKKLSEAAQEILENIWINCEEHKKPLNFDILRGNPVFDELLENGYLKMSDGKTVLADKGLKEARQCVRRHRLAERLMADVFDLKKSSIHEAGCKFEHILYEGIEEEICTLLGHPKECPHGSYIPSGKCCEAYKKHPDPVVKSLAEMEKNETGVISYVHTKERKELQKIMALGALPGCRIKLIRGFPSFVFEIGHSQFVVDKQLAQQIYVRPRTS